MGMATLIPTNGNAAIEVSNVDGVRVAGLILEAGFGATDSLLTFGEAGYAGSSSNPGSINDVFGRVGGTNSSGSVQAKKIITVNSGNVVVDGIWLWRADHDI